jgi:hypothetical protein
MFYGIEQFISHFGGFVNQVKHPRGPLRNRVHL